MTRPPLERGPDETQTAADDSQSTSRLDALDDIGEDR